MQSQTTKVANLKLFITLTISKRSQIGIWTFLRLTTCLTKLLSILLNKECKLQNICGTLGLEVTNSPGTAEGLVSQGFFQTVNIPFQKIFGFLLSAFVFTAYLPHLRIIFLHAVYCCCFLYFHVLMQFVMLQALTSYI